MNLGTSTLLVGGVIGLLLAVFGVKMLVTGRGPASTLRNFPGVRAAAFYHLLFGLALLLMVLGQTLLGGPARVVVSGVAIVLVGVALVKYRPRVRKPVDE
ncbi:hypothetical protein [Actinoplanes friuliensis]|jgi:hypothetical protein|uniref:Integral membrane protein n=1 Tax=Actinoplanes friuliensis DSM 7358 TaxID=1246995 RepID=U5VU64_9ACTN|nr:hypothetical protein [Actinoplanes friuliensis]AGZ39166.1 hypothetical protein AFR_04385 [Actinoplanes friuliensis DSM 7358]